MTLIIETGARVVGAESYISASDCTTYHSDRGNLAWIGTDQVKEAALRRAASYLDGHYRKRWKGEKYDPVYQPMEWPRIGAILVDSSDIDSIGYGGPICVPPTTIPQRLKDAQCELALRALSGDLAVDGESNIIRKKVDVLETEFVPGTIKGQKVYQIVDQLLSDLLKPIGSGDAVRG